MPSSSHLQAFFPHPTCVQPRHKLFADKETRVHSYYEERALRRPTEAFQDRYPGRDEVFNPQDSKENRLRWAFESLSEDLASRFPFK